MQTLTFITDYIKNVIEGGNEFTSAQLFICLMQLSASLVNNGLSPFIKAINRVLSVTEEEWQSFVEGLIDIELRSAF